jgi:spectinomycin phosphotransferase
MIEKPPIPDDLLISTLRRHYHMVVTGLQFLPVGNDATAWAFKANGQAGGAYFLKIKKSPLYAPGVEIPFALNAKGLPQVLAPLPRQDGALWVDLGEFNLILYSFIAGENGGERGLSGSQWSELGRILRAVHTTCLGADLVAKVHTESFQPQWGPMVRTLDYLLQEVAFNRPCEIELARFWQTRRNEIFKLLARTEKLGRSLRLEPPGFVLCHADIHPFNILLDGEGSMYIVDWDGLIYAPKERDLMFIGDPAREVQAFYERYGPVLVNPLAQAYYHYEWVVQEIGDFGERVFLMEDIGPATREQALKGFFQLFQPGDVVEGAYQYAAQLLPGFDP